MTTREGARIISVRGTLDVYTTPRFKQVLNDATNAEERLLAIDLSGVSYLDSTAHGRLIHTLERIDELDKRLGLVVTGGVRKALEITGIDKFISIFATLDELLAAMLPGLEPTLSEAMRRIRWLENRVEELEQRFEDLE